MKNKDKIQTKIRQNVSPLRIRRAFFHILIGSVILYLSIHFYANVKWMLFTILLLGIALSLLSLRFELPFIYFMLKKFEKPKYIKKFPGKGALFFVAGSLLVLKLFPYGIALASIAITTFADPTASLSGLLFGRKNYRKPFNTFKKIEGTIIGIVAGFFAASFFVSYLRALIASTAALLTEALTLKLGGDDVDDNLIVPLVAATILYLVGKFVPLI